MRRWELRVLILSSSTFIFTIERDAVVSAATITYPFPVRAKEVSIAIKWRVGDSADSGEAQNYAS